MIKVRLFYRGNGFKAKKEVELALLFEGMDISMAMDDGFSAGLVTFRVSQITLLLNHGLYVAELECMNPSEKMTHYQFEAEGWTVD